MSDAKTQEREIAAGVKKFMLQNGWRRLRMQSGMFQSQTAAQPFQIGEKGMADLLFLYYRTAGVALALWVETKAPGKSLRPDQIAWIERERAAGGMVVVVDHVGEFELWYVKQFHFLPATQQTLFSGEAVAGEEAPAPAASVVPPKKLEGIPPPPEPGDILPEEMSKPRKRGRLWD